MYTQMFDILSPWNEYFVIEFENISHDKQVTKSVTMLDVEMKLKSSLPNVNDILVRQQSLNFSFKVWNFNYIFASGCLVVAFPNRKRHSHNNYMDTMLWQCYHWNIFVIPNR